MPPTPILLQLGFTQAHLPPCTSLNALHSLLRRRIPHLSTAVGSATYDLMFID